MPSSIKIDIFIQCDGVQHLARTVELTHPHQLVILDAEPYLEEFAVFARKAEERWGERPEGDSYYKSEKNDEVTILSKE